MSAARNGKIYHPNTDRVICPLSVPRPSMSEAAIATKMECGDINMVTNLAKPFQRR